MVHATSLPRTHDEEFEENKHVLSVRQQPQCQHTMYHSQWLRLYNDLQNSALLLIAVSVLFGIFVRLCASQDQAPLVFL